MQHMLSEPPLPAFPSLIAAAQETCVLSPLPSAAATGIALSAIETAAGAAAERWREALLSVAEVEGAAAAAEAVRSALLCAEEAREAAALAAQRLRTYCMLFGAGTARCSRRTSPGEGRGITPVCPTDPFNPHAWLRFLRASLRDLLTFMAKRSVTDMILVWRRHAAVSASGPGHSELPSAAERAQEHGAGEWAAAGGDSEAGDATISALFALPLHTPLEPLLAWVAEELAPWLGWRHLGTLSRWLAGRARAVAELQRRPHHALQLASALRRELDGGASVALGGSDADWAPVSLGAFTQRTMVHLAAGLHPTLARAPARRGDKPSVPGAAPAGGAASDAAEAEADVAALEELRQRLHELAYLHDTHGLHISLAELTDCSAADLALAILDRVSAPELLPDEVAAHVTPYARRHGLSVRGALCASAPPCPSVR